MKNLLLLFAALLIIGCQKEDTIIEYNNGNLVSIANPEDERKVASSSKAGDKYVVSTTADYLIVGDGHLDLSHDDTISLYLPESDSFFLDGDIITITSNGGSNHSINAVVHNARFALRGYLFELKNGKDISFSWDTSADNAREISRLFTDRSGKTPGITISKELTTRNEVSDESKLDADINKDGDLLDEVSREYVDVLYATSGHPRTDRRFLSDWFVSKDVAPIVEEPQLPVDDGKGEETPEEPVEGVVYLDDCFDVTVDVEEHSGILTQEIIDALAPTGLSIYFSHRPNDPRGILSKIGNRYWIFSEYPNVIIVDNNVNHPVPFKIDNGDHRSFVPQPHDRTVTCDEIRSYNETQ